MDKILLNLLKLIDSTVEEIFDKENKYKILIKATRKKLKMLHPDAGGQSAEFEELYEVYEQILKLSKTDKDEKLLSSSLNRIKSGVTRITQPQVDESTLHIDDETVINIMKDIVNERAKSNFDVKLAELVEHFNRLKYCSVVNRPAANKSYVQMTLKITAEEPDETGIISTSLTEYRCVEYNPSGKYVTDLAFEVKANTLLEVELEGCSMLYKRKFSTPGCYNIQFTENFITVNVRLTIKIEQ